MQNYFRVVPNWYYGMMAFATFCNRVSTGGVTMVVMSKPKKETRHGLHKPRVMVGVPTRLAEALRQHAKPRMQTLAELLRHIAIDYLTARGEWPPPEAPGK